MSKTVLAIDPGSGKCGLAAVRGDGKGAEILHRHVCDISKLGPALADCAAQLRPDLIVVGDGTNSKNVQAIVRDALPGQAILILDERDTTIRARERYWEHTPRRGWRRFLPSSMQVPPVPIDDFVAVILAERALSVE